MSAIVREAPAPIRQYAAELPDSARLTLDRLLAKEPRQRYQSFQDVRVDLRQVAQETSGQTPLPQPVDTGEPSGPRRTPYVGRKSERAELRRLLDEAIAGLGSLVLIDGEPGVGKTRLTEELVAEARARGCLTLTGHCYEAAGTPPFIPFVEILERAAKVVQRAAFRETLGDAAGEIARIMPELRRIFPDLPPPTELPPDQQRRFLFNAYSEFAERANMVTPVVTVYEDLHWADEPTVQLVRHLAVQVGTLPSLMIGTYRDVELDVSRPFARELESLLRERLATRIALRRLPETDVETMLEALGGASVPAGLAQVVFRETEGNPFFVEEVFQHLSEEGRLFDDGGAWKSDLQIDELRVPEGVRLVIGRRLERVSDDALRALTTGAVIGRHFDLRLLEAAGKVDEDALLDALEAAEAAQLITSTTSGRDVRYTFAHELIRQTLVENLSLPRRQRLHLRIATALEKFHGASPEKAASNLAHHFYQAGAAAGLYRGISGDYPAARDLIDQATRVAEPLGDRQVLGDVLASQTRLHFYYAAFSEELDVGRRAVTELQGAGDVWQATYTEALMQYGRMFLGRPREILEVDAASRPVAQRLGHHQALFPMDVWSGVADLMLTGHRVECEEFFERRIERWRGAGALGWMGHLYVGSAAFWQGRWDRARIAIDDALQQDLWSYMEPLAWGQLMAYKAYAGDPDTLSVCADRLRGLPASPGPILIGHVGTVLGATEALAVIGERDRAHTLYPWILELMKGGMVMPAGLMMTLNETGAGIAAACGAQSETTERHHKAALQQADEMPNKIE